MRENSARDKGGLLTMANAPGKITSTAAPVAPAGAGGATEETDKGLPDASSVARLWLAIGLAAAVVTSLIWNGLGTTGTPFDPSKAKAANFALFAGFYVGAQIIERILELISPLIPQALPGWSMPSGVPAGAPSAAHVKADRATIVLGIAALFGVAFSCGFGLYFLQAIGIDCSRTIDTLATGITIAAGTKPLHDFISTLQNQSSPKTGTGVS